MARKKTVNGIAIGTRIRVRDGVAAPEFPDVHCGGWTGSIADVTGGRSSEPKYVIEWDSASVDAMPASYRQQCEEKNLLYSMSCLSREDFDVLD